LIMRDTVSICGTHELGFKRCARTRYAGRVVTLMLPLGWNGSIWDRGITYI